MGIAYRLVRPQLTAEDIVKYRTNPEYRLTTSPFGVTPEQYENNPPIYIGKAVAWKGKKGNDFWKEAERHGNLADGLRRAIAISKKYAGTYGTVLYNGKLYPKKAIEQKKG